LMGLPPAISVLLPVRDGGSFLHDAIASVEAQSFANFEVIAVDDGSTDGSGELLATWAARDTRVRVLRQAPRGIVAALERARGEARGRYLARMDSDDVNEPTRLAKQFALMEADSTLAACGCGVRYFPRHRVRDGARRYEEWINAASSPGDIARDMFVECPIAHPTFFLRARAVEAVGGYHDRPWPEDYDLVLRLWEAGGRFDKVPERLLRWRERDGRLSRSDARYGAPAFLSCKVHYLAKTLLARRRGAVVWGAGPIGKAAARALQSAGVKVLAFAELDPRKLGQEIHGAPVLGTGEALRVRGALHLAAVGQEGARDLIRETLAGAGMMEFADYVAIA